MFTSTASWTHARLRFDRMDLPTRLGLLFGVLLPIAMAGIFPTYVAVLSTPWLERPKLLELPIVAAELVVIAWAIRAGFDRAVFWAGLPRDIRLALTVLLAALGASSLLSTMPMEAALQSLIVVTHLYFAAAIYFLAVRHAPVSTERILVGLALGLVPLTLLTAIRFGFPPPLSEIPGGKIDWNFALPGFISVRYFGTWTGAIAAALAVCNLHRGGEGGRQWFWQLLFVLAVGLTVWSGTRAAVLGGAIALALFAAVRWRSLEAGSLVRVAALTGLGCLAAWLFRFDDPIFQLVEAADQGGVDAFTAGRWTLWMATIEAWKEQPWFGYGTGSLFWTVFVGWRHTQPHNAVLQFLFSWGLVGAVPACWLVLRGVLASFHAAAKNPEVWPILTLALALLGMSMVDGALYYPRFVVMIVIGLVMAIAAGRANDMRRIDMIS